MTDEPLVPFNYNQTQKLPDETGHPQGPIADPSEALMSSEDCDNAGERPANSPDGFPFLLRWLCFEGPDLARAGDWLRRSADQGNRSSQFFLGHWLERGLFNFMGNGRDPAGAARWFRQAADLESVPAMLRLGRCYASRAGLEQDPGAAQAWFDKAAGYDLSAAEEPIGDLARHLSVREVEFLQKDVRDLQAEILAKVSRGFV